MDMEYGFPNANGFLGDADLSFNAFADKEQTACPYYPTFCYNSRGDTDWPVGKRMRHCSKKAMLVKLPIKGGECARHLVKKLENNTRLCK
jgi:hypothetical protein